MIHNALKFPRAPPPSPPRWPALGRHFVRPTDVDGGILLCVWPAPLMVSQRLVPVRRHAGLPRAAFSASRLPARWKNRRYKTAATCPLSWVPQFARRSLLHPDLYQGETLDPRLARPPPPQPRKRLMARPRGTWAQVDTYHVITLGALWPAKARNGRLEQRSALPDLRRSRRHPPRRRARPAWDGLTCSHRQAGPLTCRDGRGPLLTSSPEGCCSLMSLPDPASSDDHKTTNYCMTIPDRT